MSTSHTTRLELYVRSLSGAGPGGAPALVERLERLSEAGVVTDYEVHVWGDAVSLAPEVAGSELGSRILDRVEAFRAWATDRGVELPIETRRTDCAFTGECEQRVVLPAVLLAEYRDDDLSYVTPHSGPTGPTAVTDRLDELAGERRVEPATGAR